MFDRQGKRKYLTDSERLAFFKSVSSETDENLRCFALTLFNTGCRISEALNTTSRQIDLTSKEIVFETLKQRKRGSFRAVPLPEEVISVLCRLTAGKSASTKVWEFSRSTGYRFIKATMASANIRGVMASPKGLRHGFAVACLENGVPLTTVKKWLGHARLETTAIYLDVSGQEERKLAERVWFRD